MSEEEKLAKLFLEASYKPQREAEGHLAKHGFTYDTESSTMERKVFVDKEGKPHIAHRGSIRASDWAGNLYAGLTGKTDAKMKQELEETEAVLKKKYAGKEPTFYGHSRGGLTAEKAGEQFGGKVYTFNKATVDPFKKIRAEQTDIRTTKDIVSLPSIFQSGGTKKTIKSDKKQGIIGAHSVSSLKFH